MAWLQPELPWAPDESVKPAQPPRVQNTGGPTTPANPAAPPTPSGPSNPSITDILNDPMYAQGLADLQAASASDLASLGALIQRGIVQSGLTPDLTAGQAIGVRRDLFDQFVTPDIINAASNNKLSLAARLDRALKNTQSQNRVQLRQRGAVKSGEQGHLAQQAQTGFDEAKYDLVTRLFETIIAGQGGYLTAEQQRAWQRWQMAMDAARRAAENSGGGGGDTSGGDTSTTSGSRKIGSDQYGNIWQDENGNIYNDYSLQPRPRTPMDGNLAQGQDLGNDAMNNPWGIGMTPDRYADLQSGGSFRPF